MFLILSRRHCSAAKRNFRFNYSPVRVPAKVNHVCRGFIRCAAHLSYGFLRPTPRQAVNHDTRREIAYRWRIHISGLWASSPQSIQAERGGHCLSLDWHEATVPGAGLAFISDPSVRDDKVYVSPTPCQSPFWKFSEVFAYLWESLLSGGGNNEKEFMPHQN